MNNERKTESLTFVKKFNSVTFLLISRGSQVVVDGGVPRCICRHVFIRVCVVHLRACACAHVQNPPNQSAYFLFMKVKHKLPYKLPFLR